MPWRAVVCSSLSQMKYCFHRLALFHVYCPTSVVLYSLHNLHYPYPLLHAHHSMLIPPSPLPQSRCLIPIAPCHFPISIAPLPHDHCLMPIAPCPLFIVPYLLPIVYCPMPISHSRLPIPVAPRQLPHAHCSMPIASCHCSCPFPRVH